MFAAPRAKEMPFHTGVWERCLRVCSCVCKGMETASRRGVAIGIREQGLRDGLSLPLGTGARFLGNIKKLQLLNSSILETRLLQILVFFEREFRDFFLLFCHF